ncbi:MAG TPA: hypothetical protein PL151_12560 [Phycisphaerae bacterium]|nr:hypothetical protein [Phycisphaerae bacterium]HOJ73557.1 hypothetical protein [Phycisphaerae bacterium]HOM51635.1 hypothetical protein [Phycisphaerae bacterium]HON65401.1 hypothetical protein [Phycisphaerae bacterium]HOQ85371.1 hypothetical protein [Phycisphaerae bacterium]
MPEGKLGPPGPVILAMVICDAIHQDPATKKCTLLGTFSTITARSFPVVHPGLAIHVALTDGRGNTRIRLSLVSASDDQQVLFTQEGVIQFADPRVVAEINFGIRNLTLPHPGEYRVQIYANDELLGERRLHVMALRAPGQPPGAGGGKPEA